MIVIKTTVYEYDELSEKAKERAMAWFRDGCLYDQWWDSTYEDASNIGLKITSFDLDRNRHAREHFINSAQDTARLILLNHGTHCETYKTAKAYLEDIEKIDDEDKLNDASDDFLKSILEDYSILLQKEYEYLMSDEHVEDVIRINEYTFTEEGLRF